MSIVSELEVRPVPCATPGVDLFTIGYESNGEFVSLKHEDDGILPNGRVFYFPTREKADEMLARIKGSLETERIIANLKTLIGMVYTGMKYGQGPVATMDDSEVIHLIEDYMKDSFGPDWEIKSNEQTGNTGTDGG